MCYTMLEDWLGRRFRRGFGLLCGRYAGVLYGPDFGRQALLLQHRTSGMSGRYGPRLERGYGLI